MDAHWKVGLDELARAATDSMRTVGGPRAANEWLLAAPRGRRTALSDDAFRMLIRARLRLPLVGSDATCAYFSILDEAHVARPFRRTSTTRMVAVEPT